MSFDVYNILQQEVDICDGLSGTNDDASCPSVGSYYISETIEIPMEIQSYSSLLNMIGISVYAYDESGSKVGCFKASVSLSSGSSSSSIYSSAQVTASIAFVGAVFF